MTTSIIREEREWRGVATVHQALNTMYNVFGWDLRLGKHYKHVLNVIEGFALESPSGLAKSQVTIGKRLAGSNRKQLTLWANGVIGSQRTAGR